MYYSQSPVATRDRSTCSTLQSSAKLTFQFPDGQASNPPPGNQSSLLTKTWRKTQQRAKGFIRFPHFTCLLFSDKLHQQYLQLHLTTVIPCVAAQSQVSLQSGNTWHLPHVALFLCTITFLRFIKNTSVSHTVALRDVLFITVNLSVVVYFESLLQHWPAAVNINWSIKWATIQREKLAHDHSDHLLGRGIIHSIGLYFQ